MDGVENGNGHRPNYNGHLPDHETTVRPVNPYADAARGGEPPEIVDFEMRTDPYANMLPGISNIRAAETMSNRARARGGRPWVTIVSLLLVLVLVLPAILALISQLTR